ncbi:hypothetical protein C1645_800595 [Glomus cerebriforme]|uniref:HMG box domain-containing protein n=1 Tax=Glomus cerebriforme TaxID=658196 RepID=A0A397TNR3_9GLOM|nr:hypothetical protein C1645_800595 [Glomus cerebriforme]
MNTSQVMIHHNYYHKFPQVSPVDARNVTSSNSNNFNQIPSIKLPFPPTIRASDIAKKRLRSRICSKSPNAFFIYRKAFVDQLSNFKKNNKLKMTEVSRLVSSHWKMESKQVKIAYEEIAKQVEQELNNIRNKDLVYTDDFDTESVNYEENCCDELTTATTYENDYNDNNDNIQQLQRNDYNSEEFTSYHSPISESGFELNCDDSNLLTPPICGEMVYNDYNDYIIQYQQNEFNLYESFLKANEISTPNSSSTCVSYPIPEDRGLDYYLGYFDNLS